MAKTIATILGIGFLLVGLIGFISPGLLGMHLNTAHNLVHILTGAASLYFGLAASLSAARTFDLAFGAVYTLLGVVGFIVGSGEGRILDIGPLHLGTPDHAVHILLGVIYLIGGLLTKGDVRGAVRDAT